MRKRRPPLRQCCPYFTPRDHLAASRTEVAETKRVGRGEMMRLGNPPRIAGGQGDLLVRFGRAYEAARPAPRALPGARAIEAPTLKDPYCVVTFNANTRITTIDASARIKLPPAELAPVIDPRAWGLGGGVIDIAFPVTADERGQYRPSEADLDVVLGTPWGDGLLFEYARSEVASFENILAITRFEQEGRSWVAEYRLHDCLKTIIGFYAVDGGLQKNSGFVRVDPDGPGYTAISVQKNIRVRDMTPSDPGNRYDFGEWINSTLGSALGVWVDDTSMMSPVF